MTVDKVKVIDGYIRTKGIEAVDSNSRGTKKYFATDGSIQDIEVIQGDTGPQGPKGDTGLLGSVEVTGTGNAVTTANLTGSKLTLTKGTKFMFVKGSVDSSAVLVDSGSEASNSYAVAEGYKSTASGNASHAGGNNTVANAANQTVIGQFNALDTNQLFIVGNGNSNTRKNIFTVSTTGTVMAADGVKIKKNSSTDQVSLIYDNANKCLKFVFK